jgi:hypothetical protein
MKKAVFLATVALLAMLVFAPVALALQEATPTEATPTEATPTEATPTEATPAERGRLAPSGGPAILLPAAALLLGSGVLTYAILRRR